ncbi:MAG: DUF2726 domain-containing protein [Firmicutes bacterium]|nr:DUF2726 domain-containing protein [Bacillota bacterium]MBQ6606221.1 DUF2726 domain-containing protein [Bacillota bacterium]
MGGRLLSVALVVMVGIIIALTSSIFSSAKKAKKDPLAELEIWSYETVDQLLSKREFLFFQALEKYLAPGYRVFPKVRLMSFVRPSEDTNLYQQFRSRIGRKYVDFLIVDDERLRVKAAIEYDEKDMDSDKTPDKVKDMERILDGADVHLFRFEDRQDLFEEEDFAELNSFLTKS